ncbi:SNF2 family helicase/ATPase-like protein [Cucurbitaria berberidis CBS 394.84]|uniref:SNF2 family helicase/ATPase-like protein n=1 Tax=Cucurbitaria berberidis CBS 394.84 TaxID=1168544 RepID=A0A9P4GST0_9PLEO|nr:SNF2 family helicase/ATPase-like protein [Cucurbitaria berberidis CBS 394.84]KAF1850690.1 SNF2 family helicase/ATPase-like protein [Cucurbitaria berberidis CBS 394.84]
MIDSPAVYHPNTNDVVHCDLLSDSTFTVLQSELTADLPGDAATHHNNNAAPVPRISPYDPRALLNPRAPNPKRPASSGTDIDRGRTDPTIAGQVSLVERLHNVQERTASPAKRVKTANDERTSKANHSNFSGGSALDLKKPNGQPPLLAQGPSIDLTMSDDEDDIQVVADNGNDDICIGKVKQTYIQAHLVPNPDPKKYSGNNGGQSRIKVSFRRSGGQSNIAIMVTDGTGREFGKIDIKTAQGLAPLIDSAKASGLKWMAWTEPRRKQPNEGAPGTAFSGLIGMTLQLYCPRKHANDIGKYLKNKNLLLEQPLFELHRHDYFNPQTSQSSYKTQITQPNFQPTMFNQHAAGAPTNSYVLRSVDEIRADVEDVFNTVVSSAEEVPTREPSSHIKTELYPHQKQALYFMVDKEQDHTGAEHDDRKDSLWKPHYRDNGRKSYIHVITGEERQTKPKHSLGGILADEMGLGKTLSILSLICDDASIAAAREFQQKRPPPLSQGTALIQPVINSRATLLVCPLSTMTNWKEQIKEHFPVGKSALRWTRYHGTERFEMSAKDLANYDIVVTTYHIIAKDLLDRRRPLPLINWFRIVLDEAHTIRNPTNQSKAVCSMQGQRKWAVTGTPVQNRLEDLGALFNFIRLSPFDSNHGFNQFILHPFKNADPEVVPKLQLLVSTVTIRRTKEIIKHEVPAKNDYLVRLQFSRGEQQLHDWFEQDTQRKVNAVTQGEKMGGHSYARILTAILNLRLICAHGRDLLSDDALKTTDGMSYDNPMEIGEEDEQVPTLSRQQAYEMLDLLETTDAADCIYCPGKKSMLDADSDSDDEDEDNGNAGDILGYMTTCYHLVCPKHIKKLKAKWKENLLPDGSVQCHVCEDRNRPQGFELRRRDFANFLEERDRIRKDPKLAKKVGSYMGPHTKTQALLNDLKEHQDWSDAHPNERPIKSIVFSSWTTHLDLIEIALKNHAHAYVRLDGRMTRDARDKSMHALRHDDSIRVMLVSIGAGGLGLNLTTANKVFMMEPQFNPAAEAQAVDRVHRLGQDREVVIKRFIMEGSFEEKMLELQKKKKALADLTMARERKTKEQATKQRLEELRSLFR